ncbi:tigger transposable element-derived protein 6-like [Dreissena polymorpha]|uniref:tigger transposable element-derived protein 6-like n=1 Tax=Dreissena polymorpha TaxID=45954 RepID=UPI002264BDCB|nr:tigger transposable element-derived protein 6-like [Dreissena polymorpha]
MRIQKRKVILLVDNCSAHSHEAITILSNVTLSFLPPNTTSLIQPCDQGIIRNLKSLYRRQVVKKMIEDIDQNTMSAEEMAKKLTLLDTMHMLTKAWNCVTEVTIRNCFAKAGFTKGTVPEKPMETAPEKPMETAEPPLSMNAISFAEYVKHDDDLECLGMPIDDDICSDILQEEEERRNHLEINIDNEDAEEEDADTPIRLPRTASDARKALEEVRKFLEDTGFCDYKAFNGLEILVEKVAEKSRRQTKITGFHNYHTDKQKVIADRQTVGLEQTDKQKVIADKQKVIADRQTVGLEQTDKQKVIADRQIVGSEQTDKQKVIADRQTVGLEQTDKQLD